MATGDKLVFSGTREDLYSFFAIAVALSLLGYPAELA